MLYNLFPGALERNNTRFLLNFLKLKYILTSSCDGQVGNSYRCMIKNWANEFLQLVKIFIRKPIKLVRLKMFTSNTRDGS